MLLLDEPTSGLDLGHQVQVLELVDGLRRTDGLTVVSAMHDLTLAARYSDRIALLVEGELVAEGAPADVLRADVLERHYGVPGARVARTWRRADRGAGCFGGVARVSAEPPVEAPARAERREPSLVVLHTGDGKGKTTAAMGIAMRAAGHGERVAVVQFMKSGRWKSGERLAAEQLGVDWSVIGDGFTWDSDDLERAAEIARRGVDRRPRRGSRRAPTTWSSWTRSHTRWPGAGSPTAEVVAAIRRATRRTCPSC